MLLSLAWLIHRNHLKIFLNLFALLVRTRKSVHSIYVQVKGQLIGSSFFISVMYMPRNKLKSQPASSAPNAAWAGLSGNTAFHRQKGTGVQRQGTSSSATRLWEALLTDHGRVRWVRRWQPALARAVSSGNLSWTYALVSGYAKTKNRKKNKTVQDKVNSQQPCRQTVKALLQHFLK